jgi:hypothetical protein
VLKQLLLEISVYCVSMKTRQNTVHSVLSVENKKRWSSFPTRLALNGKTNMDPIRLLLTLILGLFPRILHHAAIPLATVLNSRSRQHFCDYALGHDRLGWYRVTLEVRPAGYPAFRVVEISQWSRGRPDRDSRQTRKRTQRL